MKRFIGTLTRETALIYLTTLLVFTSPVLSANAVDIGHTTCSGMYPPGWPMDTIWDYTNSTIDIYVENDEIISGLEMGFKIWSPDGATWQWDSANFEIIPIPETDPPEFDTTWSIVTVATGSRMYPPSEIWDQTGLQLDEINVDGTGYDTLCISGFSSSNGLMPGPMERQLKMHLRTACMGVKTICIDSAYGGAGCDFVFIDAESQAVFSEVLWPEGGKCFIIHALPNCIYSEIYTIESMASDLSICETNQARLQGSCIWGCMPGGDIPTWSIAWHTGNGVATVTQGEYVYARYYPSPLDIGKDVSIMVHVSCPCASDGGYQASFHVTGSMPTIEAGRSYECVGINNTVTKTDIAIDDPEECLPYQYQIVSGPGEIDPTTGVYTWVPAIGDVGHHEIVVAAYYQDNEIVTDNFTLDVEDIEVFPGNANCDNSVNIGDAIFVLNHVFSNGPVPPVANWGDANGDCHINIGDGVRLVGYSFSTGPEPVPGCVE